MPPLTIASFFGRGRAAETPTVAPVPIPAPAPTVETPAETTIDIEAEKARLDGEIKVLFVDLTTQQERGFYTDAQRTHARILELQKHREFLDLSAAHSNMQEFNRRYSASSTALSASRTRLAAAMQEVDELDAEYTRARRRLTVEIATIEFGLASQEANKRSLDWQYSQVQGQIAQATPPIL